MSHGEDFMVSRRSKASFIVSEYLADEILHHDHVANLEAYAHVRSKCVRGQGASWASEPALAHSSSPSGQVSYRLPPPPPDDRHTPVAITTFASLAQDYGPCHDRRPLLIDWLSSRVLGIHARQSLTEDRRRMRFSAPGGTRLFAHWV